MLNFLPVPRTFNQVLSPAKEQERARLDAADRMHSAAIHILRYAAQQDAYSGQGPARLSALSVLVFGGAKTLGELAEAERVKPPTMSRIVTALKRAGLVRTEADAEDARRLHISVTPKGESLLQQARERRIQFLAQAFKGLDRIELELLREAAGLVEQSLQKRPR
jgi:DNA-binding MarR family transcriptional regulator